MSIKIEIRRSALNSMGCTELTSVYNLLKYACDVRGNEAACREVDRVRTLLTSKGCSV